MLSSETKVMCWTPRSCTDRVTQDYPVLSSVPAAPEPDVQTQFLHIHWPSLLTDIAHRLQYDKEKSGRTHSKDTPKSQQIKHHLEEKPLEASLLHSVGTAPWHCLHQRCCCTHRHPDTAAQRGLKQIQCSISCWSALWKPAGFTVTWCTGYSAISHSYHN